MLVFMDETGDHNLGVIDTQYPIFGLGALMIEEAEYERLDKKLKEIKGHYFENSHDFILHASELKRPKDKRSDNRNIVMLDPETRKDFYRTLDEEIIKAFDFKLVVCFILKIAMVDTYKYPADPYHFSYENLLNRIIRYGGNSNVIYAERRNYVLDTELIAEHERLAKIGVHSFTAQTVTDRTKLKLISKKDNESGLQIIDLILSCLARAGLGKKDIMVNNDLTPEFLNEKMACPRTVFPRIKKKVN